MGPPCSRDRFVVADYAARGRTVRGHITWDGWEYLVSDGGAWHSFASLNDAVWYAHHSLGASEVTIEAVGSSDVFMQGLRVANGVPSTHVGARPASVDWSPDETVGMSLDDLIGRNDELEQTLREELGIE